MFPKNTITPLRILSSERNITTVRITTQIVNDIVWNAVTILSMGAINNNRWYLRAFTQYNIATIGDTIIMAVPKSGCPNTIDAGIRIIAIGTMNVLTLETNRVLSDKYFAKNIIKSN